MNTALLCDENLVRRLPLPLAQLYRRAHNAHRAKERKETAYCLWEAAIKLLGCVCVCEYAQLGVHDPRIDESLQNLARPALGHWVGFIRQLLPTLRDHKVPGFDALADALMRRRDDLPRVASLYAVLWQTVKKSPCQRTTVQPLELFDRLTEFRNQEVGHGAIGQQKEEFYVLLGNHLLSGAGDLLSRIDLLAGRHLYYLQDLRKDGGLWISHRLELDGQSGRSVEPLTWPAERGTPPVPQAVYLDLAGPREEPGAICCLQPLVIYDEDDDHLLFMNSRTGNKKTEYLSYQSGKHVQRPDLGGEHRALLRRVLKLASLDEEKVAQWVDKLEKEERDQDQKPDLRETHKRIGEFELISELGRGAQGTVYRAIQPSLNREVALKLLVIGANSNMDRHFLHEIRALGRVDHPNLIKIYTSGVDNDQWYYAMELIEGADLSAISNRLTTRSASSTELDLTDWRDMLEVACDEARQGEKVLSSDSRSPRPGSMPDVNLPDAPESMRERLAGHGYVERIVELIRQVSQAAHALHQNGIIHRDIKPANIMVDRRGERAVLMDLGLAKLTDQSSMSVSMGRGGFVGTYRYASPEQVNPQLSNLVNERSDVYSLGATLWELLTLKPLYGAGGHDPDLIRKILQDDPPLLRSIHHRIHPDLEAIVAKCLEKKPTRRYATARELAEDLQRYLNKEPVLARPVSRVERVWRYILRRPLETGLVAVCAIGLTLITTLVIRNLIQSGFIDTIAKAKKDTDEANGRLKAVNQKSLQALERFLDRLESGPFKRNADVQPFRQDLRDSLDGLATAMKGDPTAKAQLADLYLKLSRISRTLDVAGREGKSGRVLAREAFDSALALFPAEDQVSTEPRVPRILAEVLVKRGELEVDDSRYDDAERNLQAALKRLPTGEVESLELLDLRGEAYHQLGRASNNVGQFRKAIENYNLAVVDREMLLRRTPSEDREKYLRAKNDLARAYGFRGDAEVSLEKWPEADASYQKSRDLRKELVEAERNDPEYLFQLARGYANFGYLEREQFADGGAQRIKNSIGHYEGSLVPRQELFNRYPAVSDYRRDLINAHLTLVRLHLYLAGLPSEEREAQLTLARKHLEPLAKLFPAREKNEIRPYQASRSQTALWRAYALVLEGNPSRKAEAIEALNEAEVFLRAYDATLEGDELYDAALLAGLRAKLLPEEASRHLRTAAQYLRRARDERGYRNHAMTEQEFALEDVPKSR